MTFDPALPPLLAASLELVAAALTGDPAPALSERVRATARVLAGIPEGAEELRAQLDDALAERDHERARRSAAETALGRLQREREVVRRSGLTPEELCGLASDLFAEVLAIAEHHRSLDAAVYESYLREFAARARILARAGCPNGALMGTFRAVQGMLAERPPGVYIPGLKREEGAEVDLSAEASRARVKREARLWEEVAAARAPRGAVMGEPLASDEETEEPLPEAIVAASNQRGPVAIFGGVVVPEKVEWLERMGLAVVWYNGAQGASLASRLASGSESVSAVIVLSLLSHAAWSPVLAVLREKHVPYAMALTGGKGRLRAALVELAEKVSSHAEP